MDKQILFLSKGEHSASTRYRALIYFPYLEEAGWKPIHLEIRSSLIQRINILLAARKSTAVVLIRYTLNFPFLHLLRYFAPHLIFDYDDAIFSKSKGQRSKVREIKFRATLRNCDQVWAGNEYLREKACEVASDVIFLPTSIDMARYGAPGYLDTNFIDLVWIGSSSTSRYIKKLLPVLEKAAIDNNKLRLVLIADFSLSSEILPIKVLPWSHDSEVANLKNSHIGLAPLWDDSWTRGKCALKVLQYMASRMPVISSAVGANNDVVVDGDTGLLVNGEGDWLKAIAQLAKNRDERESMGDA